MFKCKRIVSWVLAMAVLAGLGGCGKIPQSIPESSTVSAVISEASSSVETNSTVEYVPLDRFEDDIILNTVYTRMYLAENEITSSVDSKSDPVKNWAALFITQNYQSFSPKYIYTDSLSGSRPKPSIFVGNETSFVLQTFRVTFETTGVPDGLTPNEDGTFSINLQVVMKENADHSLTLLGFVTNQTRDIKCPFDLAEFLKVLPEYENLEVAVPEPVAPLEAINLTDITGGLLFIEAWPVGDAVYILGYNPDFRLADGKNITLYMKVYSAENLTLLYEKSFPAPRVATLACYVEDEGLIFTPERGGGQPYYLATENGVKEIDYTPADERADKLYRLSDTAVILQTGVDLLLEKDGKTVTLLKGVPYDDNSHVCSRYRFLQRVSDTTFTYIKMGWEFPIETGIYDIETGKTTLFTHNNANCLVPIAVQSESVVITPYWDSSYTSYGPYLYDLASGQLVDLGWFDKTFYPGSSKFLCFDNKIASFSKTRFGMSVLFCDFTFETTPRRFDSLNYNTAEPTRIISTGGYLWFCSEADSFSDTYLFRIPIEETMKK
ncbi:MAG TPA: hypothetical protein PK854_04660 [Oscillospiraceae bacterium]|nr:hypothetical protein [Oscillospiraceae bacterium]